MGNQAWLTQQLRKVEPVFPVGNGVFRACSFLPNLTIAAGTVVGEVTAASVAEVQTITCTPTVSGGAFKLTIVGIDSATSYSTAALAYGITNANLKIAVDALLLAAGYEGVTVAVTGGPLPTSAVLTFGDSGQYLNPPLMTVTVSTLSGGGSYAVVHTTTGVAKFRWGAYVGTVLANPTAGPTVASKTGGSTLPVLGQYMVQYSYGTAAGETLLSAPSPVALTTTDRIIAVSSITLPANATTINLYVNGAFVHALTATGAYDISTLDTAGEHPAPVANTASTNAKGLNVALGIAQYSFTTDDLGQVLYGDLPNVAEYGGVKRATASVIVGGAFKTSELTGLDAAAVAQLGRLQQGSVADGILWING